MFASNNGFFALIPSSMGYVRTPMMGRQFSLASEGLPRKPNSGVQLKFAEAVLISGRKASIKSIIINYKYLIKDGQYLRE